MSPRTSLAFIFPLLLVAACSSSSQTVSTECTQGEVRACLTADDCKGTQTCDAEGHFAACMCGAGAGGTSVGGSGGSSGSAGRSSGGSSADSSSAGGSSAGGSSAGGSGAAGASGSSAGGSSGAGSGTLFFSEYVEGATNKALELYNAGPSVDLSQCTISAYADAANLFATIPLSGTLAQGGIYIICSTTTGSAVNCDSTSTDIQFNGNDALILRCGTKILDHIGQYGVDPPNGYWGTEPYTTSDHTLRRKCSIRSGDTNTTAAYDPFVEWDSYSADDLSDLGKHCQ